MYDNLQSPPAREPEQARTRGRRQGGGWMGWVTLICSVLALCLAGAALYLTLREEAEPPAPPEPVTFQYRDMILEAKEGVPVNSYDSAGFTTDELGRIGYEQDGLRARAGIDVSFYQGEIDWEAVAADGVEFAMIRLGYRGYTEGSLQLDSWFEENIRGARMAGLDVGVYFFSQASTPQEAEEEADFVVGVLAPYNITYPVAFDWEFITQGNGARTDNLDGETLTQCAAAFCARIAQAGYQPLIYFNQDLGYLTYDLAQLTEYPFWLAEYGGAPDFYYGFSFWQYTHAGTVAGIEGHVDWNLDLRAFGSDPEQDT